MDCLPNPSCPTLTNTRLLCTGILKVPTASVEVVVAVAVVVKGVVHATSRSGSGSGVGCFGCLSAFGRRSSRRSSSSLSIVVRRRPPSFVVLVCSGCLSLSVVVRHRLPPPTASPVAQVISVLLNLDQKSPNKNTVSLFVDGEPLCAVTDLRLGCLG